MITEVNSFVELVTKATNFAFQLQDGWYKGSAEVEKFQDQVLMLSEKHDQWTAQLRRHGLSEDKRLLLAVQLAVQVLEKQQRYVARLQKNHLLRLRRKAFPAQLCYSLNRVAEIVDAGRQLLAGRVATHDLLDRSGGQTPAPLPFVSDPNYVPISASVKEIENALERADGPRVVTVYGEPGLGKSSVVKFIALHYADQRKEWLNGTRSESPTFPDGVYYLLCGQEATGRVKQLQLELTDCLGFGGISSGPPIDSTTGLEERQYYQQVSPEMKLRSRLVEQKLLIILDDLWEGEVLQQLLVPANGVKYLISSQLREIWGSTGKIQLKSPTMTEARHIMANYTAGLQTKGEFPHNIQCVTDEIIWRLCYHPLSLANVGISINRSRVADATHWKAICDNLHVLLDKNDLQGSPVVYNRPYNLTVSASMMVSVEALLPEPRKLLFLIALLEGEQLPESLVRYFYKFVQDVQSKGFLLTYNNEEKYLEDRTLVTLHMRGPNIATVAAHKLRTNYIRRKKTLDLQSIASQIVTSSDQGLKLIHRGDAEETLVTILSAMYYRKPFTNVVISTLQRHLQIINAGVVPRNINCGVDALQLVKRRRDVLKNLLLLLNVDHGEPHWKQQAHQYAKKIIIKLACQEKLDDHSMACLLKLPQTASIACGALSRFIEVSFFDQNETFSSAHPETMKTLLALVNDSATSTTMPVVGIPLLVLDVLDFERKETIVKVGTKWMEILGMDSNSSIKTTITEVLVRHDRPGKAVTIMCEFTEILEVLMGLLVCGKDYDVRVSAGETLLFFCEWKRTALKIASIPDALVKLFSLFLSNDVFHKVSSMAGVILENLLREPKNRRRFQVNKDALEGLGDIVAKVGRTWRATPQKKEREMVERYASIAAGIIGDLALEEIAKETIVSLPGVLEGLLFLQTTDMAKQLHFNRSHNHILPGLSVPVFCPFNRTRSVRALTILYSNPFDPSSGNAPSMRELELSLADEGLSSETSFVSDAYLGVQRIVTLTRVLVHLEMGAYKAALQGLDLAQHHLDRITEGHLNNTMKPNGCKFHSKEMRLCFFDSDGGRSWHFVVPPLSHIRIFLQVMLEDHAGALLAADAILEDNVQDITVLIERAIIKRLCGDYEGALDDLNLAYIRRSYDRRYSILKHRGYVKYLMQDEAGAREDAEAAQELKLRKPKVEKSMRLGRLCQMQKQPINYLGYFL